MEKDISKYIKISDFADLCKTNRKTLIYYDKENIFKPKYKDSKGYRYYHISQYDSFSVLMQLREIGVSLGEIKEYLDNRSPEEFLNLLNKEREKTKLKIKNLNNIIKNVENKISTTEEGINSLTKKEPYIEFCKDEYFNTVDIGNYYFDGIIKGVTELVNKNERENIISGFPIGAIVCKEDILNGNYFNISKLIVKVSKNDKFNFLKKEEGLYVVINHSGPYEETKESYKKLLGFILENGYEICSDSYEEGLLDYLSTRNEKEFLTKISVRIKECE